MTINNLILNINKFIKTYLSDKFPETFSTLKNLFAIIGVFASIYLLFFLGVTKPNMIKESEVKIEVLTQVIETNNKEISKLERENKKIVSNLKDLNEELSDLQIKNKKYVNDYEKNIARISNMSDNDLTRTFTKAFPQ